MNHIARLNVRLCQYLWIFDIIKRVRNKRPVFAIEMTAQRFERAVPNVNAPYSGSSCHNVIPYKIDSSDFVDLTIWDFTPRQIDGY